MAYILQTPIAGSQKITDVSDTINEAHPVGTEVTASDTTLGGATFIYLMGVASTAIGTWVVYDDYGQTALLTPNYIGPVAIAMAATGANQYGWYQRTGQNAVGKVAAGFVDNANVYITATPGTVDDAVVAGDRVKNARGASAIGTPSAGLAYFEISRPFVDDGLAA